MKPWAAYSAKLLRDLLAERVARAGHEAADALLYAGLLHRRDRLHEYIKVQAIVQRRLREQIDATDEVLRPPDPKARRPLANVFAKHLEHITDSGDSGLEVARLEGRQTHGFRLLLRLDVGGDANVAGAVLALATNGAADGDHGHGRESDTIRAKAHHLDHVAPALHAPVAPQLNAVAQPAFDECTMRQPQPDFHRQADVAQGVRARRPRSALVAGQRNDVGAGLGHSHSDDADARYDRNFHGNAGVGVGGLQLIDQLRQVLDGVEIMVVAR